MKLGDRRYAHSMTLGGRPDVMKLIREAYYSWNAEVVFITSNYQGNREMMEGCKVAGIPAFVSATPFLPDWSGLNIVFRAHFGISESRQSILLAFLLMPLSWSVCTIIRVHSYCTSVDHLLSLFCSSVLNSPARLRN